MRSLGRKRAISIVLTLMMTLAIIAPVLVSPAPAAASTSYTALTCPTVNNDNTNQTWGKVKVTLDPNSISAGDALTVSIPNSLKMLGVYSNSTGTSVGVNVTFTATTTLPNASAVANMVYVYVPKFVDSSSTVPNMIYSEATGAATIGGKLSSEQTIEISVAAVANANNAGAFYIYFGGLVKASATGDIQASFLAPANGGFSNGAVTIAKGISGGSTTSVVKDTYMLSASNQQSVGWIVVAENSKGSITSTDTVKIKLPAGFKWYINGGVNPDITTAQATSVIAPQWGFDSNLCTWGYTLADESRTLQVAAVNFQRANDQAGRFTIKGLAIDVNETEAKQGDIVAHLWSSKTGTYVTEQDLTIGTYGTYGITVAEKTSTEIKAGRGKQEIGEFTIKETLPGSLISGRTITLTLPAGARWHGITADGTIATNTNVKVDEGDTITWTSATCPDWTTEGRILKLTVNGVSAAKPATLRFTKLNVDTAPNFSGDLKIDVAGTQTLTGSVKVATVKPLFAVTADAATKLQIGMQNQKASDVLLTENFKEALEKNSAVTEIFDRTNQIIHADHETKVLALKLPSGASWYARPTLTVEDGDIVLDTATMAVDGRDLTVNVKVSSSKPSKIKISNIAVTLDRTVPEGEFKINVGNGADADATGETYMSFPDVTKQGAYVIGTCVTPAPNATGRNASFYIGSNVMESDGAKVIMDVAPYIKDGRTFVPVKYLGQALGVADSNIVWDATAQTATLTKDTKTIVLTIGSKTAKVNGADVAMDVAPEIVSGRTMLPARYVAEGLGYQVGYIASTKQVVIQ